MNAGTLGYKWYDPGKAISVLTGSATVSFENNPAKCILGLKGKVDSQDLELRFTLQ